MGGYSWGSSMLSYVYHELCKVTSYEVVEMGGACVLVQLWAWERFQAIIENDPYVSMFMI